MTIRVTTDRRVKPEPERLSRNIQLRMTESQYQLLRGIAEELERPLGAVIRDVVTVWALNHESSRGRLDVSAMVAELQALEHEW